MNPDVLAKMERDKLIIKKMEALEKAKNYSK
jgi:hypothetical protein